jgi:hypothetical protein
LDAPHGQHRGVARSNFARDHRLQSDDDHRGQHDRVDRSLGHRPVCTATVHGDPHAVGCCQGRAGSGSDLPGRKREDVLAQRHVNLAY